MRNWTRPLLLALPVLAGGPARAAAAPPATHPAAVAPTTWTPSGWGGGGFYYAAAFHPARDGVLYLAGDVGGVYRSDDRGRTWAMTNAGLADYGVFTLAVDGRNP